MGRPLIYKPGDENFNKYGEHMVIYRNEGKGLLVKFDNGEMAHTNFQSFKDGGTINKFTKKYYGIACTGTNEYIWDDPAYSVWNQMLVRCYNKERKEKRNMYAYDDATVCEEWLTFTNFREWYYDNYYEMPLDVLYKDNAICLDKDILKKGNKTYSPDTCIFVPSRINKLMIENTGNDKRRINNLPIGVKKRKYGYAVVCSTKRIIDGKSYIGFVKTPEEGFKLYKETKEALIKHVAEEYKPYIPTKLYEALMNYTVDIDD